MLGPEPYFSQGQHDGKLAPPDVKALEAARLRGNPIAFVGLHESQTTFAEALPSSDFSAKTDPQTVISNIKGTPYFSLDVSDADQAAVDRVLRENASVREAQGTEMHFTEPRAAMGALNVFESAIFAEARTIVDWNARNKVRFLSASFHAPSSTVHLDVTAPAATVRPLSGAYAMILRAGPVLCLVRQLGPFVLGGLEAHMLDPAPVGGECREEALCDRNRPA